MQSKGRARSNDSHYFIMEAEEDCDSTAKRLRQFKDIQEYLCKARNLTHILMLILF